MNSRDVGNITAMKAASRFIELGYNILFPFGDNLKYDFVLEKENKFIKVQSKTSRLVRSNSIEFNVCVIASNYLGYRTKYYTKEDVDLFVTVWGDKVFAVPSEIALQNNRSFSLNLLKKSEARQIKGINFAEDYII